MRNSKDLIDAVLDCRPYSKFAKSVAAQERRNGFVSDKQHDALLDMWNNKISDNDKEEAGYDPGEWC